MPGDIDDMSAAVGALQAQAKDAAERDRVLFKKFDRVIAELHEMNEKIGGMSAIEDRVEKMEPIVDDYRDNKNRIVAIAMFLSAVIAAAFAAGKWVWDAFVKGAGQ
jgi:hypothetical protein